MAAPAARRTIGQLWQQACTEIPEVVGATGLALVGLVLGTIGCYNFVKNDGDNRKYKLTYVIMRPDDPRVARLRRNE